MTARARLLAGYGESARPYSHLLPVLEAELSWGNSTPDGFRELPDGWWAALLRQPLHVDRLAAAFDFDSHIRLGRDDDGATWVVDGDSRVRLVAAAPRRPDGGARSLLSRILRR